MHGLSLDEDDGSALTSVADAVIVLINNTVTVGEELCCLRIVFDGSITFYIDGLDILVSHAPNVPFVQEQKLFDRKIFHTIIYRQAVGFFYRGG